MIRSAIISVTLVFAFALAWADTSFKWRGSKGWEAESAYCRLYDTKTVVTLTGTILRIEKVIPMKGMGEGVYFMLKTDQETIPVHLGPVGYVEIQPIHFGAGELVVVTGSRVSCDGKPAILAATLSRGIDLVIYRQLNGRPAWVAPANNAKGENAH